MFKKTRLRLTLLHSIVFTLFILVMGFVIYDYVHTYIYKDVDHSLLDAVGQLEKEHRLMPNMKPPGVNPQQSVSVAVWSEDGQLLNPDNVFDEAIITKNRKKLIPEKQKVLKDVALQEVKYRVISVEAILQGNPVTVTFIRNIDVENQVMSRLLHIMIVGCVVGIIFAVAAGFFLAARALRPIKHAWDKQQQFVSDASHEIRTPIAVIQSRGEVLLQSPQATIQEKADDVSVILKECRRLTKLVKNLLTLARSDSNTIQLDRKKFALNELLQDIVGHYAEFAQFQGKEISLAPLPAITFYGDRDRIHQLLIILLDNAMKYTDKHGVVKLSAYETKHTINIEVADNGIGRKEEELANIFDRFYQVDKSRSKTDSLGLGLSIAVWIVEQHEGKIKVKSQWGSGSCFTIVFPKKH
ncbi:sensor histidine kinase [Virgibacillus halophilus]|uniref:histidine kinase n=1 Tax=Tigheibacillus halophilus TaxID=361280 RepID=A0ABU5C417_9BACI|nr:HAMP domain-containing sensor histidine kinase [Virgibacillus halophilus]